MSDDDETECRIRIGTSEDLTKTVQRQQKEIRDMRAKLRELRGEPSPSIVGPAGEVVLLAPGSKRRDN